MISDFLQGEIGNQIRSADWSESPIGAPETWPAALRTATGIMLNAYFPMYIAWGDSYTQLYNKAFADILGEKNHPEALGRSARETFADIWDIIGPVFDGVRQGNSAGYTDLLLPMNRHGHPEECYFIFSANPLLLENGETGGIMVTVAETTAKVIASRRMRTLERMSHRLSEAISLEHACAMMLLTLEENPLDIPFALCYRLDAEANAHLEGSVRLEGHPIAESFIGNKTGHTVLPLAKVIQTAKPEFVTGLSARYPHLPGGEWPESPDGAYLMPITRPGKKEVYGVLVLGISPRKPFDEDYRNFYRLFTGHIANALGNILAAEDEQQRREITAEKGLRQSAEEKLVAAEERLRLATDGSGIATWDLNLETKEFIYSPRLNEIFGHDRTVTLPHNIIRSQVHPDDEHIIADALQRASRNADYHYELRIVQPNGDIRWIRTAGRIITGPEGKNTRMVGTTQDISGHVEALHTLETGEERLRLAMLCGELGTWDHDLTSDHLEWSDRTKELFGLPAETHVSYGTLLEALHMEDRERIDRVMQQLRKPGSNGEFDEEYRVIGIKDKKLRWIRSRGKMLFDKKGTPYRFIGIVLDMTSDKLAEKKLVENESRFRNMADNVPMMIWITRKDGTCTYLNRKWQEYTGQDPKVGLGVAWMNMIHPDDLEETRKVLGEATEKRVPFHLESRLKTPEGEYRWVRTTGSPRYSTTGEFLGHIGAVADIEQRKRAEQKLQESEALHRRLLQSLPTAVYTCDSKGNITFYNDLAVAHWGYAPQTGSNIADINAAFKITSIDGTELTREMMPTIIALQTGQSFRNKEVKIMLPDGATRYLSLNVDPVYDTENRITGAVTVLQDITDAHEAQESMSRLAAIVESSDDAIISKTLEGIVTSWNDSAERIFGYTADEMIGQSITRLIPDDRLDEEKHILARLRNGERIDHFQTRRVTKAGKLLDISLTISPLKDANGRIIGASKVARDITRLKETERNTAMLAAIVHTSQDAIVSKTLEGIVTSWNDSAERIFGYTSDEMIGQSITRIIPQDRQEEEPMILERLKRGEQVNHFQTKRLTKTGKLIDISLSISPIYDPSGVVIGASKIARPLTGGEKLAKNERNYNMLGL